MIGAIAATLADPDLLATLSFALLAGIATFFSPCAYPLLPGYAGFYVSQTDGDEASLGGAIGRGLVAGAGVLATFVLLLGAAYWIGHAAMTNVVYFEPIVGAILVVLGALVVFDRAPSVSVALPKRRSSVLGFGVFGAGYALAAAGCVAPLFIGVIGRALSYPTTAGTLVVGTYVGSVVVLMVALTVATGMGLVASAGRLAGHGKTLRRLAGAIMVIAGLGQLYLAFFVLEVV